MSEDGRTGARILVDALAIHDVDTVFGVPGESYLAVLDALYDTPRIRFVTCRQEGGAAMMADAYGKLAGRPGICMVSRGPGATNASAGVHVAYQDSTPLILFIGQVARGMVEREAFQEIDYRRMYGEMAKWVAQIDDPARVPEFVSRAFHTATSGRPGPVVLALPEDMLAETATVADTDPYKTVLAHPGAEAMAELREGLAVAKRPLMMLGGGGWDERASTRIRAFAEASDLPTCVSFRSQSVFDNTHKNYVGHAGIGIDPKLATRIEEADLLVVVGARLGEATTSGYTLVDVPSPRQGLVHVHPDPEELGRVYQPDLAINAAVGPFAAALDGLRRIEGSRWHDWTAAAREDYLAFSEPTETPGELQLSRIVRWLSDSLPDNAIVTNGAGNYAAFVNRFYRYRGYRTQLAPTSGSMGYGLPAAIAAKLRHPERTVVAFAGDGCFQMTMQELGTAVQYGVPIIVLVANNASHGSIRMHQERLYPTRVSGTDLVNPDFAALARTYGAYGGVVRRTDDFADVFQRALKAEMPSLIELRVDLEAITPGASLGEIRAEAMARQAP